MVDDKTSGLKQNLAGPIRKQAATLVKQEATTSTPN